MRDKHTHEAKGAFLWHIVICCGPIIVLSLVGTGTVMSWVGNGLLLLIVGVLFIALIAVLLYRSANSSESEGAHNTTDRDTHPRLEK